MMSNSGLKVEILLLRGDKSGYEIHTVSREVARSLEEQMQSQSNFIVFSTEPEIEGAAKVKYTYNKRYIVSVLFKEIPSVKSFGLLADSIID